MLAGAPVSQPKASTAMDLSTQILLFLGNVTSPLRNAGVHKIGA